MDTDAIAFFGRYVEIKQCNHGIVTNKDIPGSRIIMNRTKGQATVQSVVGKVLLFLTYNAQDVGETISHGSTNIE
jgi:hypothetical protein